MGLLDWVRDRMAGRDGQSRALTAEALAAGQDLAGGLSGAATGAGVPPAGPAGPAGNDSAAALTRGALHGALAVKLLSGFLSNRRQIQIPLTLNLAVLSPDAAAVVVEAMAAAVQADGQLDAAEERLAPQALRRIGATDRDLAHFNAAMAAPAPLAALTARIEEHGLATHAYAAALMATNRRSPVNRAFLDYLGQRLGLTAEVTGGLQRRYRA